MLSTPGEVDSLETPRLLLRPLTVDDAPAYLPLVSEPRILAQVHEHPLTDLEQVRQRLRERLHAEYASHGYGRLAVIDKSDGRLVGWCGLKYVDELGETDIGYRFLPDCWGRGYASEAGAAVLRHGFETLELARIIGLVLPGNAASAQVLRKLGLRYERRLHLARVGAEADLYALQRPAA
nr:GNAT family N-acetyltransferase [Tahibacter harae]